jgi:hypothetical protein
VVIVNERFAEKYFPGQNVIGKRITPGFAADESGEKVREIIGVVGNVKHLALKNEDSPEMYVPHAQIPFSIMSLVVRTSVSDPAALTSAVRKELAALDPPCRCGASACLTNTSRARSRGPDLTRCCFRSSPA